MGTGCLTPSEGEKWGGVGGSARGGRVARQVQQGSWVGGLWAEANCWSVPHPQEWLPWELDLCHPQSSAAGSLGEARPLQTQPCMRSTVAGARVQMSLPRAPILSRWVHTAVFLWTKSISPILPTSRMSPSAVPPPSLSDPSFPPVASLEPVAFENLSSFRSEERS